MSGSLYLNIHISFANLRLSYIAALCLTALCLSLYCVNAFSANRNLSSETSIDYTMHRLATEYNDPSAQYLVGRNYLKGKSVEKNVKEAIKWFEMAAKQNHIRAQYQLGKLYLYGKEIKTNLNFAFYFLSKAAEKNHLDSQYELANYYLKGNANKRQYAKAAEWYQKAAKRGHVRSQFELGKLLYEGHGILQNHTEALNLINEAAESGLLEASNFLDNLNEKPTGKTKPTLAVSNERDSDIESDLNFTLGDSSDETLDHYQLGIAYLTGEGKEKNIFEASKQFELAANAGHGKAQYQLAKLYEQGIGVKQSDKLHLQWLEKAAKAGVISAARDLKTIKMKEKLEIGTPNDNDPDTQYSLGMKYLKGDTADKDPIKASKLLFKAADQNQSKAQYQLGVMYEKGIGFDKDADKARKWYQKAADAGLTEARVAILDLPKDKTEKHSAAVKNFRKSKDPLESQLIETKSAPINTFLQNAKNGDRVAQYEVGISYLSGEKGFERDVKKAVDWLQTAANNHYTKAKTALGMLYYEGSQVDRDYKTAAMWLEKSANDGDSEAQFTLGTIYQRGLGVEKNNTTAIMWYRKAANQGHRNARKQLGGCRIC